MLALLRLLTVVVNCPYLIDALLGFEMSVAVCMGEFTMSNLNRCNLESQNRFIPNAASPETTDIVPVSRLVKVDG